MMEDHWDEYLELGNLIKALADDEKAYAENASEPDYEPAPFHIPHQYSAPSGHFDRGVQLPVAPFGVEEFGQPVNPDIRPKLDPLPYVQYEGSTVEKRYSAADPMRVQGQFKPRKGFEEDETMYSFISRLRQNRG